jgi:hypothetical protein
MSIFAIIAKDDEEIARTVQRVYPDNHKKGWSGLWFVVDEATVQQVADKLGTSDGVRGHVFVCSFESYSGYGPNDIWEWLALKGRA